MYIILSEKFPKNSLKFFNIFRIEKTIIVSPKLDHNHYAEQILAEFSLKNPKNSQIFHKNIHFSKFSTPAALKIWSFMSQKQIGRGGGVENPHL